MGLHLRSPLSCTFQSPKTLTLSTLIISPFHTWNTSKLVECLFETEWDPAVMVKDKCLRRRQNTCMCVNINRADSGKPLGRICRLGGFADSCVGRKQGDAAVVGHWLSHRVFCGYYYSESGAIRFQSETNPPKSPRWPQMVHVLTLPPSEQCLRWVTEEFVRWLTPAFVRWRNLC